MATVCKKQEIVAAELRTLLKQGAEEKAAQRNLRKAWEEEVRDVGETLKEAASFEMEELRAICHSLREELFAQQKALQETARVLGGLEEAIDSHALVRPLINLLQGIEGVAPNEARIAATALCLGLTSYLEREMEAQTNAAQVRTRTKQLLEALERWKT